MTEIAVPPGSYVLSDSDGPHGYTTGNWVCDAGTVTGNTLQLPSGADVTCTLTQTKDTG